MRKKRCYNFNDQTIEKSLNVTSKTNARAAGTYRGVFILFLSSVSYFS